MSFVKPRKAASIIALQVAGLSPGIGGGDELKFERQAAENVWSFAGRGGDARSARFALSLTAREKTGKRQGGPPSPPFFFALCPERCLRPSAKAA